MENVRGYVRWRGDLSFAERPFNVVDNLVLCALAYLDLDGLVPTSRDGGSVTVAQAARTWRDRDPDDASERRLRDRDERRLTVVPIDFLDDLAASERFSGARLSAFVDTVDTAGGMQFSAVTVRLDDGSTFVAYRGTDNTILGWQEDFTMSFEVMPSQRHAAAYLAQRVRDTPGPVRVGGHSKGGNLAVYAAMRLEPRHRDRVVRVYSNDGPGLGPEVADPGAAPWLGQVVEKIVPEFGVIGLLFDDGASARVVASSARGLIQHDLMTWGVEGADLVELDALSPRAALINQTFDAWLEQAAPADRRDVTEAFFGALRHGGAELVLDVGSGEYGSYESVVLALRRSGGKVRRSAWLGTRAMLRTVRGIDVPGLLRQRAAARAALAVVVGSFFTIVPRVALQVLGSLAVFVLVVVAATRLWLYYRRFRREHRLTVTRLALWVAVLAGVVLGIAHLGALVAPTNVLLGLGLVANAWATGQRALRVRAAHRRARGSVALLTTSAVVSLLLGVVAWSTADRVLPLFVLQVGQYLLLSGLLELFLTSYRQAVRARSGADDLDELWTLRPGGGRSAT